MRAAKQRGKKLENSSEASVVEDNYNDGDLLIALDGDSKPFENWILDSGCMFHMCPNWEWFSTYETMSTSAVMMGTNATREIAGIGTI